MGGLSCVWGKMHRLLLLWEAMILLRRVYFMRRLLRAMLAEVNEAARTTLCAAIHLTQVMRKYPARRLLPETRSCYFLMPPRPLTASTPLIGVQWAEIHAVFIASQLSGEDIVRGEKPRQSHDRPRQCIPAAKKSPQNCHRRQNPPSASIMTYSWPLTVAFLTRDNVFKHQCAVMSHRERLLWER